MLHRLLATLLALSILAGCKPEVKPPEPRQAAVVESQAVKNLTSLINPAKLDTLKGKRAANRRLRLICYHLEAARREEALPRLLSTPHKRT